MKLSIAWIFDHIKTDWKQVDLPDLLKKFNLMTAEIEGSYKVALDLSLFSVGQVTDIKADKVVVFSSEWDKEFTFPKRPDAHPGSLFLITQKDWATLSDLKAEKEGLFPALTMTDQEMAGSWKNAIETEDIILEIDNKAITNRPDMWSHRGFAREMAALLNVQLKPWDHFLAKQQVKHYEDVVAATAQEPFSIVVRNHELCKHYAGIYIKEIESAPSLLWMAYRLSKVDARPINALVDMTNYVMFDVGQPMHAFDAQKISTKKIEVSLAKQGQQITLLDGAKIELTSQDVVITDGKQPIALAGIMGGQSTGITQDTESVFLESACFDPSHIRKTSARLKLRTEASARFEKSLDPNLNLIAINRFLKLMHESPISMKVTDPIVTIGAPAHTHTIELTHQFIETKLGIKIKPDQVKSILEKIDFIVDESQADGTIKYKVTVPSFRATRDILIKEDILEEVGRFFGYDHIPHQLPPMTMHAIDTHRIRMIRKIKQHLAYATTMHEVQNYAFYDEELLHQLQWRPEYALQLKNPVSENWKLLVTSLIPGLLKAIRQNELKQEELRFFELARVWHSSHGKEVEGHSLAGIIYQRKHDVDFYQAKSLLASLFELLDVDIAWEKANQVLLWYDDFQTARLMHKGKIIGTAGKIKKSVLHRVAEGDAFIFELDAQFLTSYKSEVKKFVPLSKFPEVWLDISMFVPVTVMVNQLIHAIQKAEDRIVRVELVDFFEKEEWAGKRSLTFRYFIQDKEKTLTKEEIESISHAVVQSTQTEGATIR